MIARPLRRIAGPSAGRHARHGFTLVELLVAIWIMSIVSIIAWRGLSALVATRDRLGPEADDVRAVLTGFGQMERDLAHAAGPVLGSASALPVSVQIVDGAPALQVLRFSEPLANGASAVQLVTYSVMDGALSRCTAIVQQHGGTMAIEEGEVGGARFVIRVPALDRS